jgi:hypothetical protein
MCPPLPELSANSESPYPKVYLTIVLVIAVFLLPFITSVIVDFLILLIVIIIFSCHPERLLSSVMAVTESAKDWRYTNKITVRGIGILYATSLY